MGLGAAGVWAAKTLTERGLDVVGFDAGRQLSGDDLPGHTRTLSSELRPATYWEKLFFGRRRIQARSVSFHPEIEHLYVDDVSNPYSTRGGSPFLWIRGRQVGGRMHTWARMALRLSDADFERATADGHGEPWPIRYADLAPYYDRVETHHGLAGAHDRLPHLPDGRITEVKTLDALAERLRQKLEARWPERHVIAPRVLRHEIGPTPSPLRDAVATNRFELVANAPVARVVLDDTGRRAVGVECFDADAGELTTVTADRVFLCASAIETVRLLLNSRHARHPHGLGNDHDLLGRYVLDHNFVVGAGPTGASYRDLAGSWQPHASSPLDLGADLDFAIPDFSDTLPDRDFLRGFGMQGRISPSRWAIAAFGEMLPSADNRVTLTDRTDAFGIPTVNIRVQRNANDLRMIAAEKREIRAIAKAGDLRVRMPLPPVLRGLLWRIVGPEVGVMHLGLAIHECGGARMGASPETSVVDPQNRLWAAPNVLVTDGACFPNTGCQNPTLTIMAVTARACELAARG